ncbi:MAG: hypothetical protein OEV68_07580, partial [candidate division Zixibacteria bacterium]|nr:hypothetical protein [candidate division Zixibacteria bacterium]
MHQLYSVITTGLIGLLVVGGTAWAGAAGEAKTTRVATGLCLSNARLSPIGDRLAVTRRNCDHDPHLSDFEPRVELLISEIGSSDFRSVLAATDIDYVSWSADGKQILARAKADGKHQIMLIDVDSETNRQLDLLPTQSCWSPDGRIIATSRRGGILLFDLTTTDSTILRLPDSTVGPRRMDWSPTGRHILFTIGRSSNKPCPLWTVAVDGSTAPMLIDTAVFSGRWCPDGDGVNVLQCGPRLNKSLVRIPIDPETGAPQGDGTTLLQGIEGDGSFTVSADGRRLLYEEEVMGSDVWLFERTTSGSYVKKLLHSDNRPLRSPAISRDGEKLLCVREFNSGWGPSDIYVFDLTSGEADSVTTTASFTPSAAWSPDGRFIALPTGEGDYCSESYLTAVPAAGGPHRVFETEVTRRCGPQIAWQPMEFISYFGKTNKNRSCYYPDVDSSGLFNSLDTLM